MRPGTFINKSIPSRFRFVLAALLSICGVCAGNPAVAGVVGTGTAASCTESALQTQIAAGGTVTFNCGGAATIAMSYSMAVAATNPATVVDGGGNITLDAATMPSPQNSMIFIFGNSSAVPTITFKRLTFVNGNATTGLVAGGAFNNAGNLTLDGDTFTNNRAAFGGAVFQQHCTNCLAASLTVVNSTFSNNAASNSGGAINLQSDTVNVGNSTFAGNSAGSGGAIFLFGNSTFTTSGTIATSTFSGNHATSSDGGAIAVSSLQGGSATITNNTFNANQAAGSGARGGAISIGSSTTLTNNTIAGNSASIGGGIYNASTLKMQDGLLTGNTGGNCSGGGFSGANNLQFGDSTCAGVALGNPLLGALANNGGPTQTMALGAGSAAIGAGNIGTCAATDQRGVARTGVCDAGAYQASTGAANQTLTFPAQAPSSHAFAASGTFAINPLATSATPNSGNAIVYSSLTPVVCSVNGTSVTMISAGTCTLAANQAGNASYNAAAQVTQNVAIGVASQAITFTSAPPVNPAVTGTYTVSATGGASGNPVTFSIDAVSTAGACTINSAVVTFTGTGNCVVDANQAGNANYAAAAQTQQTMTVGKKSTTISLAATPNPAAAGQPVTLTATVAGDPPTGSVSFADNGTTLPCSPVTLVPGSTASTAVCTAAFAGTASHSIVATYSGDGNFATATSTALVVTLNMPPVSAPALNRWAMLLLGGLLGADVLRRLWRAGVG